MTPVVRSRILFKMRWISLVLILLTPASALSAGKVQNLKSEIAKECGDVEISRQLLIKLVRKAYLTCRPGNTVEVTETCKIKCQKSNPGSVFGQKVSE